MAKWTTDDIPDQTGRTILITGANSGLGLRSAEALAAKGARVLMACRNAQKAAAALDEVAAKATGPAPEVVPMDLADLDSVAAAAASVSSSLDHLDVLMDNAGVMALPNREETKQGFEMQFGTNHLGHFALTGRLLPLLLAADAPRVVAVSSMGHRPGAHPLGRPELEDGDVPLVACLLPDQAGQPPLHRGAVPPGGGARHGPAGHRRPPRGLAHEPRHQRARPPGAPSCGSGRGLSDRFFSQSDAMGALPQLYATTMPDVAPNSYYGPDGFMEQRGYPKPVGRTGKASNADDAKRLWAMSEELTGVTYPWP